MQGKAGNAARQTVVKGAHSHAIPGPLNMFSIWEDYSIWQPLQRSTGWAVVEEDNAITGGDYGKECGLSGS